MIKVEVTENGTEINAKGNGIDLANEGLNAVAAIHKYLHDCFGGFLLSAMFKDALRSDDFWKQVEEDIHEKEDDKQDELPHD